MDMQKMSSPSIGGTQKHLMGFHLAKRVSGVQIWGLGCLAVVLCASPRGRAWLTFWLSRTLGHRRLISSHRCVPRSPASAPVSQSYELCPPLSLSACWEFFLTVLPFLAACLR